MKLTEFQSAILDAIEQRGYVVVKLQAGGKGLSERDAEKLAELLRDDEASQERLVAKLSFNALCDQIAERRDEFTDLVSFVESLDPSDEDLKAIAADAIECIEFNPRDPVVVWATVAATSENFMEVADALKHLREELRARSIYSRAQLDLMG